MSDSRQTAADASGPLPEYNGQLRPHIDRIMSKLSLIYPPLVYPPKGPREDPRQPYALPEWKLGSSTSPGGRKQAEPMQQGVYFIGDRWPSTAEAPQAIYWIPPGEDGERYAATGDTTGTSRGQGSEPDWDPTREYPVGDSFGHPWRRTGMIIQSWTILCWGNDWQDTELMRMWVASMVHDYERSQPEKYGESFSVTRGGWVKDKPGDRGLLYKMQANIVTPIARFENPQHGGYNRTFTKTATVQDSIPAQPVPLDNPQGPAKPDNES